MRNYLKANEIKQSFDEKSELIQNIRIAHITRLTTISGFAAAVGLHIGQRILVDMSSVQYQTITDLNGRESAELTINRVDINGKLISMIYTDFIKSNELIDRIKDNIKRK